MALDGGQLVSRWRAAPDADEQDIGIGDFPDPLETVFSGGGGARDEDDTKVLPEVVGRELREGTGRVILRLGDQHDEFLAGVGRGGSEAGGDQQGGQQEAGEFHGDRWE